MSDKKHIDRLFQEGFKDFEAKPSDAVWKNIESKLTDKKKKRRVIPIWWRYAGVAALLLLLLTVGGIFFNTTNQDSNNQVVDTENTTDTNNTVKQEGLKTNTVVSDKNFNKPNETSNLGPETISDKINLSKEATIAENSVSKTKNKSNVAGSHSNATRTKNKIVNTPSSLNTIANNTSKESTNSKNLQKALENNTNIANTSKEKNNNITTEKETHLVNKEKAKTLISETSKNKSAIANSIDKKDANTLVEEKNTKDQKRSIEDAIESTKDVIEDENINNRWSVTPNAAPVYFNTLSEGSSIDPQFNSNSKSGEVNMSYGISASYAVNKKISIRSGINSVNLGYNTNDVVVFQSVGLNSSSALQNINSNASADAISLISTETLKSAESFTSTNTSINQSLGYIEVPLEIQYTLSNKKLGVNLIGGFSSLFLNNNEIFSEQENGTRTFIGEANNINKTSFSANFGLGLNYKVSKKFDLNLEPIFKYQFNTFDNTTGNFSPYFIGVYTGFAIKF